MKKLCLVIFIMMSAICCAQDMAFLYIPCSAEDMALGGTGGDFQEGVSAGLWQGNTKFACVGLRFHGNGPLSFRAGGFGTMGASYDITDSYSLSGGSFRPLEGSFSAGADYSTGKGDVAGVTFKIAFSSLAEDNLKVKPLLCFHYSRQYGLWTSSCELRNIGAASCLDISQICNLDVLEFRACAQFLDIDGFMFGVGVQYELTDYLIARSGLHYGREIPSYASCGLSLKVLGYECGLSAVAVSKDRILEKSMCFSIKKSL